MTEEEGALLAAECIRVNRMMLSVMAHGTYADEVPIRIHDRATDAGHGLGGLRFSSEFLRYLGTICGCNRAPVCVTGCRASRDNGMRHLDDCEPGCPHQKFRTSNHRSHPNRLKRAFSKLRTANPPEYLVTYLIWARGMSWDQMRDQVNAKRLDRGEVEYSELELTVLYITGSDKLALAH